MFWEAIENGQVKCGLCHHQCILKDGKRGICGVRENQGGVLMSLVYGSAISQAVDPIEKKPLHHFLPGSTSLSIATVGCNFRCLHCQNYSISHIPNRGILDEGHSIPPERIVQSAVRYNCASISYTYTEPTVFYEYAYEIAKLASEKGIKNVFVTNGYTTAEALKEIKPYLHAANVDLKFFDDAKYQELCGAKLDGVLETIRTYHELGIWIELTTLIIPGHNDDDEQLKAIAGFIAELDRNIPWHVTAFRPMHRMQDRPSTPTATLEHARKLGVDAGLKYVYVGNAPSSEGEATWCPSCGAAVIKRSGFTSDKHKLTNGACAACGAPIAGVWA